MRISIVGDGIAGRALWRLLNLRGIRAEIYGEAKQTACGIRPCGFGTSESCIRLLAYMNLTPEDGLVLCRRQYILMDGRRIKGDIYGIDKPQLLEAMAPDVRYDTPNSGDYDLIVDATGFRRACSPPIAADQDKTAANCQYRVTLRSSAPPAFDNIRGGYLWTIPLSGTEAHIGGGSMVLEPHEVEQLVLQRVKRMEPDEIACSCSGPLRLSGAIFPVARGKVVAIGEAAGLVVPFGGAGIHTAIESAVMLAGLIQAGDVSAYDKAVRKRFGWLCNARRIVDGLLAGRIGFFSLGTAYRALCYQGLKPTLADLLAIRRNLIRANR